MPRPLLYFIGTFSAPASLPSRRPPWPASPGLSSGGWSGLPGPVPLWMQIGLLVVVTLVGIPVAGRLEAIHGEDPSLVVMDEIAGMIVTYLGVAAGPLGWLAGFFWFRFFDIFKPLGVRRLERLGGGLGIMADDLGAGVLACAATHATVRLLGWGA